MSIGLKRGIVRLEDHDAEWAASAARVIAVLRAVLGADAEDIQHVGSTSIRGIPAKPIVDIAVAMRDVGAARRHDKALAARGIFYRKEEFGGQLLYFMGEGDIRTHFIHVVALDDPAWRNYILFRDYLNAHPRRAAAYGALKRELAERYPQDREAYLAGKAGLIRRLLMEAEAWKAPRPSRD